MATPKLIFLCPLCYGDKVEVARWVNPNTQIINGSEDEYELILDARTGRELAHCTTCSEFVTLVSDLKL